MNLNKISIIPIELYTTNCRSLCEILLLENNFINKVESDLKNVFLELADGNASVYELSPMIFENALVVFNESSMCFCLQRFHSDWTINDQSILEELKERNLFHKKIIQNNQESPISKVISCLNSESIVVRELKASYVFSFFILENFTNEKIKESHLIQLIEPSIIDMDDMISSNIDNSVVDDSLSKAVLSNYDDVDLSDKVQTYISWATIVSVISKKDNNKTKNLLTALELRLQIVWNKCYCISQYIEEIFEGKNKAENISELYWSFARTLDDAKSVLSSTLSSRADRIFKELIDTSKVEGEITRLEQKVNLLDKYIDHKNTVRSKKYQVTIELLLFITAIASLAQIFFTIPINFINNQVEIFLMIVLSVLGVVAIYKSKK